MSFIFPALWGLINKRAVIPAQVGTISVQGIFHPILATATVIELLVTVEKPQFQHSNGQIVSEKVYQQDSSLS